MKVMGCDCSSKLIDCVLIGDEDLFETFSFESKNRDWDVRSRELFSEFQGLIKRLKSDKIVPDIIYIEQAVYLQNVKVTLAIDSVINAVKFISYMNKIPYNIIDNKSWKKQVLGNGKASKEQIMEFAKLRWGDRVSTQDQCDAACIALSGYNMLRR